MGDRGWGIVGGGGFTAWLLPETVEDAAAGHATAAPLTIPIPYPPSPIRTALKSFTFVRVGPVTTWSSSAAKNECASLASRQAAGSSPRAVARARVSGRQRAPATAAMPSTPSVSAASACTCTQGPSAMPKPEQELDVAATAAVAAYRDRSFAAGQQQARRRVRLARRDDPAHEFRLLPSHLPRLALHAVRENHRAHALLPCHTRRRVERHARRRDDVKLGTEQPRLTGFTDSHSPRSSAARAAAGSAMPWRASTASASAQVVGSATVGPDAMSTGTSPGTSEMASVTRRAG